MSAGVTMVSLGCADEGGEVGVLELTGVEHGDGTPASLEGGDEGEVLLDAPVDAPGGDEVVGDPLVRGDVVDRRGLRPDRRIGAEGGGVGRLPLRGRGGRTGGDVVALTVHRPGASDGVEREAEATQVPLVGADGGGDAAPGAVAEHRDLRRVGSDLRGVLDQPGEGGGGVVVVHRVLGRGRDEGLVGQAVVDAGEHEAGAVEQRDLVLHELGLVAAGPARHRGPTPPVAGRRRRRRSPAVCRRRGSIWFGSTPGISA